MRIVALVLTWFATTAQADTRWSTGLNLRAETGTHPFRVGAGIERRCWEVGLVLDPMFVTDGQHDIDLLAGWGRAGWGFVGGWRTSTVGLLGGTHVQQKLLVGVTAPLPKLGPLRVRWAFELAAVVVKHGADLPTDWFSLANGRDFVDLINFGMFLRIDYVGAL